MKSGVYIDITGNKEIYKRPEMVHLLQDCKKGIVNLIFSQTRAYLAANTCDFCFLLKYLFDIPMRVDVVTDDDDQRIDTILDADNQRQGFVGIHPNWSGINAESIRSLCLNAYLPEEVVELNDMTEMRSGKKSDMALVQFQAEMKFNVNWMTF